jgi:hypothetical protein
MTFVPKYVFYREAARIVAERCGLKEGQANPLDAALSESLILPEVIVHGRRGQWRQIEPGEWNTLEIIKDNAFANPNRGYSVVQGDDHVRILMAEIDRLWPPAATIAATDLPVPADDDRYAFIRMQIEAIKYFESIDKRPPKIGDLEKYFLDKKQLPDGTRITKRLAKIMATLSRSPRAMKGGIKRLTIKGPKQG